MPLSLPLPSRRLALAILLGCLLCLSYLITFGGIPKANDELFQADATQAMALRGSNILNQTQYVRNSRVVSDLEPLQPILAAPLYWIGYHLPWVGNMHTLFLFNPLVTALTAILIFYAALYLGYEERTALIAGLAYGLTTMAWPYTRGFFREPLAGLTLLAALALWDRWRRSFTAQEPRRWWWMGAAAAATFLALLGKDAAIFALPMLALTAWPGTGALREAKRDRTLLIIAAGVVIAAALAIFLNSLDSSRNQTWGEKIMRRIEDVGEGLPYVPGGVGGMLISPGRGIWWFSPVLLLALASPALLPKNRWRESWLILGTTVFFAAAYAVARRDLWFGGAGWGARFMLPMLPALIIAALPGIEWGITSARRWPKILLGALVATGLGVQIVGTYVDIYDYSAYLEQMTGQQSWLGPGIWDPRWSQIIGGLLFMPVTHTDIKWLTDGTDWVAFGVLGIATLLIGTALLWVWRNYSGATSSPKVAGDSAGGSIPQPAQQGTLKRAVTVFQAMGTPARMGVLVVMVAPVVVIAVMGFVLWRSMPDVRYKENTPEIEALRMELEGMASPQDTVMLSNWHYSSYFMNSYKGRAIWWGLPNAPGERFSPEQAPAVVSDNLDDLMGTRAPQVINRSLQGGQNYRAGSIWLVGDASPFLDWATRPAEWYLAEHAYFVSEKDYASNVRLTRFLSLRAPDADDAPGIGIDAAFGDSIRLIGADIETGRGGNSIDDLRGGDLIGLSLLWERVGEIGEDYIVAVHLVQDGATVIVQQDRQPVDGFRRTSTWKPGEMIRDNFGFVLPGEIAAGEYELWVTIYRWPSLEKLDVGGGDHVVVAETEVKSPAEERGPEK